MVLQNLTKVPILEFLMQVSNVLSVFSYCFELFCVRNSDNSLHSRIVEGFEEIDDQAIC